MKKVIWRPKVVSRPALMLIALLSGIGMVMVERYKPIDTSDYQQKLQASELANKAMDRIYRERVQRGPEIDPEFDLSQSGLIGLPMSSVTSVHGVLISKQTSINPNFAAVIVEMLKRAGVEEGDYVAVGLSGSFPALNICTYAAIETLGLKPIVISSCSASEWGANIPDFLWIDMEGVLVGHTFTTRSDAVTIGGFEDRGVGLSPEGLADIERSIIRSGIPKITAEDLSFTAHVDARMALYDQNAGTSPIKAYINVGGGSASTGRSIGKTFFQPGLNLRVKERIPPEADGVMARFMQRGVPLIHLVQITQLAERYLSTGHLAPDVPSVIPPTTKPKVGEGAIYQQRDYSKLGAATLLALIVLSLYGFIRSDIGFRLLQGSRSRKQPGHPEPMV